LESVVANYNSTKVAFAYFGFSPRRAPDKAKACLLFTGRSGAGQVETGDPSEEATRLMIVIGSIGVDAALREYNCVVVTDYS
jgi:hypothetical protein